MNLAKWLAILVLTTLCLGQGHCWATEFIKAKDSAEQTTVKITPLEGKKILISVVSQLSLSRAEVFRQWKSNAAQVCNGNGFKILKRYFCNSEKNILDGIIQCRTGYPGDTNTAVNHIGGGI